VRASRIEIGFAGDVCPEGQRIEASTVSPSAPFEVDLRAADPGSEGCRDREQPA